MSKEENKTSDEILRDASEAKDIALTNIFYYIEFLLIQSKIGALTELGNLLLVCSIRPDLIFEQTEVFKCKTRYAGTKVSYREDADGKKVPEYYPQKYNEYYSYFNPEKLIDCLKSNINPDEWREFFTPLDENTNKEIYKFIIHNLSPSRALLCNTEIPIGPKEGGGEKTQEINLVLLLNPPHINLPSQDQIYAHDFTSCNVELQTQNE